MRRYLVVDIITRESWTVSLAEAARISGVSEDEIAVTLEEHGIVETDGFTIGEWVKVMKDCC